MRGLGAKAKDKRAFTTEEFNKMIDILREQDDFSRHSKYVAMTLWSKHLIHRTDDTCHFKMDAPHGCREFDFAIKTRTKWSKNVTTFRNCPDQILFGSKDWQDCMLLNLACYLEGWIGINMPTVKYLFADGDDDDAPVRLKQSYKKRMKKDIWDSNVFKALDDQMGDADDRKGVGSHSTRKYAATKGKRNGASRDQVEYRGRWVGERGKSVCSARYIDVDDPFADAFVASLLCSGGPIAYEVKSTVEIPDKWLFTHVIPNIRDAYQNDPRFCRVMALSLLWGSFNEEARVAMRIGTAISDRFKQDFPIVNESNEAGFNPVQKVSLHIMQVRDKDVNILKIRPRPLDSGTGNDVNNSNTNSVLSPFFVATPTGIDDGLVDAQAMLNQQGNFHHFMAVLNEQESRNTERFERMMATVNANRLWQEEQFKLINNNLRQYGGTIYGAFANQERRQQQQPQQQERTHMFGHRTLFDRRATLVDKPKDLYVLWQEYTVGVGGRKPAKDFSNAEKNNRALGIKQKYYRRLHVWQVQARLIDGGLSVVAANTKILQATGARSLTKIIDMLIKFKEVYKNNGGSHPMLRNSR